MEQKIINEVALEFAKDHYETYETSSFGSMHFGFIEGVKWQQEQDKNKYSESDMNEFALYVLKHNVITPKEWFEQNKNK